MDARAVTEEFEKLAGPFWGTRKYGNLRKSAAWNPESEVWAVEYDDPFGCTRLDGVSYKDGAFRSAYSHGVAFSREIDEARYYFSDAISRIPGWRFSRMIFFARDLKRAGKSYEDAMDAIMKPIDERKPYSALPEELAEYRKDCREVFSVILSL
jgi:hypothetical protein